MHCMNGNGPGKGKKGKGRSSTKGSPSTFPEAFQTTDAEYEDQDLQLRQRLYLPHSQRKILPSKVFRRRDYLQRKHASFLLHHEYTDTILKASGQGEVFYKMKKQEQIDDSDMPICG